MRLSLALVESDSQFRKLILDALAQDVSSTISRSIPEITSGLKELLSKALKDEPEYASLTNGKLRAELGIADVAVVDSIVEKLCDTIDVVSRPITVNNTGLSGGLTITAISGDNIGGLIGDSDAFVNDTQRGYSLPWLEWLTLKGTSPIIKDYEVKFSSSPYSRTGMALMVSNDGSAWSVPPEFAGVAENNWTTRAIERIDKDITQTIIDAIEKNI